VTTDEWTDRKRPGWLWLLIVLYAYVGVAGLFSPLFTRSFPATSPYHQGVVEIAVGLTDSVLLIAAAVALFRLRRTALALLVSELGLSILSTTYSVATDAPYRVQFLTPGRIAVTIVGLVISFLMIRYVWRLEQRGVLT
jgi:hypothetical protein